MTDTIATIIVNQIDVERNNNFSIQFRGTNNKYSYLNVMCFVRVRRKPSSIATAVIDRSLRSTVHQKWKRQKNVPTNTKINTSFGIIF